MQPRLRTLEGAAAFLLLGIIYALVSERYTLGPPWLMLVVVTVGIVVMTILHLRGLQHQRRVLALSLTVLATLAVGLSAIFLIQALMAGRTQAADLLFSAVLLWLSNVLVFGLWYWEVDAGGPQRRHTEHLDSTDFYFPQMVAGGDRLRNWYPEFLDYLFLAFNTSTAFSPTDTMVLARRAKVLMMVQSVISLLTIVVIAARAINTL